MQIIRQKMILMLLMVVFFSLMVNTVFADEQIGEKYLLRYQFHVDDVMNWDVVQRVDMTTSASSQRDTTETLSQSTKSWKVLEVDQVGTAILEYTVLDTNLWSKIANQDGAQENRYDSKSGEKPPFEYVDVAGSIGKPLAHFTINSRGEVIKRMQKSEYAAGSTLEENRISIAMPEKEVAVGDSWDYAHEIQLPQGDGTVKKITTRQRFTLQKVANGIATIELKTYVLTPIANDRDTQQKLIGRIRNGTIQFDIKNGCSVSQKFDESHNLVTRPGSGTLALSIVYHSRFEEKFLRNMKADTKL